jgi:NTP pyrophosphatase (non-canonical NTP hydrolase)
MAIDQIIEQPTPAQLERLAIVVEETGEVLKEIGKILRFGYEAHHPDRMETNRQALTRELGDLTAGVGFLIGMGDISGDDVSAQALVKQERIEHWSHFQTQALQFGWPDPQAFLESAMPTGPHDA